MTELKDHKPLLDAFQATRQQSVANCQPLEYEDYGLQAAAFSSPPKWHLAHTTWFFETFILKAFVDDYQVFHPQFQVLFNSYYNAVGEQYPRPQRGLLSRPTVAEVLQYRQVVDEAMLQLLDVAVHQDHPHWQAIIERCLLGIQHEKQHQELFFTDLKYSFSKNPLFPVYQELAITNASTQTPMEWIAFDEGVVDVGVNDGELPFAFDNESPKHKVYLAPYKLANRLVTNREYLAFIEDGGYQRSELWLADGWATVQSEQWDKPLYWQQGEQWYIYTLHGLQALQLDQPVCHLSAYEADAYANWAGARLPTEFEWEHAAKQQKQHTVLGNTAAHRHPVAAEPENDELLLQLYDNCWQWTASAYRPYPGFKVSEGAIGEYNGKFMCNQWVLRGGSCVSPQQHLRPTYRNFFYPHERWQFTGLRLAANP